MMLATVLVSFLLLPETTPAATAAAPLPPLEVLKLHHRTAEQVLPELIPLVEGQGAITGSGAEVFVRTSPERLARVKERLQALDIEPRELWVSVRQVFGRRRAQRPGAAGAEINPDYVELQGALESRTFKGFEGAVMSVRALSDRAAPVEIRRDLPQARLPDRPGTASIVDDSLFESLGASFSIVPHLGPGPLSLDVVTHDADAAGEPAAARTLTTAVPAHLGEWVEIGHVLEAHARRSSDPTADEEHEAHVMQDVLVKVDLREPR